MRFHGKNTVILFILILFPTIFLFETDSYGRNKKKAVVNVISSGDITVKSNNEIELSDRKADSFGKGYVIVRKNDSFSDKIYDSNTIYEIRCNIDLNGKKLVIPAKSTLVFNGGSIFNGTVDLNECDIIGSGLKCHIISPSQKSLNLSSFLMDYSDPAINRSVFQTLMDSECSINIDYHGTIAFDNCLSVKSFADIRSTSHKSVTLEFPNSRGFVWDSKVYSANNQFKGLRIVSKGHCFDMINSGSSNRPHNIYYSNFTNLNLSSMEGSCFYAGDNKGDTFDTCCFDDVFDDIMVESPNGAGFYGISGNTIRFVKIKSQSCGKAVFVNCAGDFDSFNGTWGTTSTFFKAEIPPSGAAQRFYCSFRNCNIESFKGILFDCNHPQIYMHLSFDQCSFYITPGMNGAIDFFPFNFFYLYDLDWKNNVVLYYDEAKFDDSHSLFYIAQSNSSAINTDFPLEITDSNNYRIVAGSQSNLQSTAQLKSTYNSVFFTSIPDVSSQIISTETLFYRPFDVNVSTGIIKYDNHNSLNLFTNSSSGVTINTVDFTVFPSCSPIELYMKNNNKNGAIEFKDKGASYMTATGRPISLAPGETLKAVYIPSLDICVIQEPYSRNIISCGTSNQRPGRDVHVGFSYFDTTLGKPIWVKDIRGNKVIWVDANGKEL